MDHSRTPSAASTATASTTSSYQMILEHVLQYQASYEIPIRTMYQLNVAQAQQADRKSSRRPSSPTSIKSTGTHGSTAQFTASLMAQVSKLPSQPCSLPTSFTTKYVRDCFSADINKVDWTASLTALDYLNDLERRRRKELVAAFVTVGIDQKRPDLEELAMRSPDCAEWVKDIMERDRKAETHYCQVYIALRRWVLINELSLQPFNKSNCFAMLNTLYPPIVSAAPSRQLTPEILGKQREQFMKYIASVEKNGPRALQRVTNLQKRPGDEDGWRAANETTESYLRLANDVIDRSQEVSFGRLEFKQEAARRGGKKTDSGVSFGSSNGRRPSTGFSINTTMSLDKSLPPSPVTLSPSSSFSAVTKSGSLLENIAKEWKKLTGKRVTEILPARDDASVSTPIEKKPKGLKKMRSMGNIGDLKLKNISVTSLAAKPVPAPIPEFDEEDMRQERMRYEATRPVKHTD